MFHSLFETVAKFIDFGLGIGFCRFVVIKRLYFALLRFDFALHSPLRTDSSYETAFCNSLYSRESEWLHQKNPKISQLELLFLDTIWRNGLQPVVPLVRSLGDR